MLKRLVMAILATVLFGLNQASYADNSGSPTSEEMGIWCANALIRFHENIGFQGVDNKKQVGFYRYYLDSNGHPQVSDELANKCWVYVNGAVDAVISLSLEQENQHFCLDGARIHMAERLWLMATSKELKEKDSTHVLYKMLLKFYVCDKPSK